jgi:nicotinamide-nucleotide amidase
MVAEILCVGTELLLGQVLNTDAQFLSRKLSGMGIELYRIETVGDNPGRVREAVNAALERCDLLITTGGLGPTEDDLTKETVAEALGLDMVEDADSMARLREMHARWGREMARNNIKQAWFPRGAHILKNARGTAPGCAVEKDGKLVIVLPGPPYELTHMFDFEVEPYLRDRLGYRIESRFIRTIGIGESDLEMRLRDMIDAQNDVTIATYCSLGESQVRLTVKCSLGEDADRYLDPVEERIRERLGSLVYAVGETDMPQVVVGLLKRAGRSLALAESCTGGKIADWLVDVQGVSEVLVEGHVTYSNIAKERTLGVRHETLESFGAVSAETAREMAQGLHALSGADYCVSVTGVAGPGGGTPDKPVGLVYMGLRTPVGTHVEKFNFTGDRYRVRALSALNALNMLRRALVEADEVTISG